MSDRIAELTLARGDARARGIAERGRAFGDAVSGASGTFANVLQQRQQARAAQRARQLVAAEFAKPDGPSLANLVQVLGPEQAIALFSEHAKTLPKPKDDYTIGNTRLSGQTNAPLASVAEPPKPPGTREVKVRNPDGSESIQIVPDAPGQSFTSAATPKPKWAPGNGGVSPEERLALSLGYVEPETGRPQTERLTEAQANTARRRAAQATRFVEPKQGAQQGWQWVMRNGTQEYVNQTQPGDVPASRAGGGRNVTSGDAGRMADFDTSLSDLSVLDTTLTTTAGATGTSAQIGAAMPAWATDLFGWGVDAKKRQGVIDRVKQVIGKTLEGGVLRKEDEIKYEKILPTIKDTADVAKSKLAGLKTAIAQRRETFLSNLEDAGFDVSKFPAERPAPPAKLGAAPKADPLGIR